MLNCFTLFSLVENELTVFNIEPMDGFVNLGHEVVFTCILKTKSEEFAVLEWVRKTKNNGKNSFRIHFLTAQPNCF